MYPFENAPEFIRELAKRVQAFNFETYHVFSSTMLSQEEKEQILALPNFDAEIFKKTTGIDVNET